MMQRLSVLLPGIAGYIAELPDRAATAELPRIGDVLGVPADFAAQGINGALVLAVRRRADRLGCHGEVDARPLGDGT